MATFVAVLTSATGLSLDHSVPCCPFRYRACERRRVAKSAHVGDSLFRSARRCWSAANTGLAEDCLTLSRLRHLVLETDHVFHQVVGRFHGLIGRFPFDLHVAADVVL